MMMKTNNGFVRKVAERQSHEPFHVVHKLPPGDSPYVRAKYFQLVEKDPETAILFFWKAINVGDRVDSALKDMAVVMKQKDRAEEAIEAIHSFRYRCSNQAQESLDNVLIDLYKGKENPDDDKVLNKFLNLKKSALKCGKLDEQIELLKQKLRLIYQGEAFNGKPTKTARSHGKKFQVTLKQETSRILGNLGWAYMQQTNYAAAEAVYRKAQEIDPDANKACNLSLCLIKQSRYREARYVLEDILRGGDKIPNSDESKSRSRAEELVKELDSCELVAPTLIIMPSPPPSSEEAFAEGLEQLMNQWTPFRSRRLPIFEEISPFRDQLAC